MCPWLAYLAVLEGKAGRDLVSVDSVDEDNWAWRQWEACFHPLLELRKLVRHQLRRTESNEGEREKEREGERERERVSERQRDKDRERQRNREIERKKKRDREEHKDVQEN